MDTQKMHYLLKVAETQSVTEAAKKLFISQPALSQAIAHMEKEFDIKIFTRKDGKFLLTTAGEILIESIREELQIEENLKRKLTDVKSESLGTISVGLSHARAVQFLPVILPDFTSQYPQVKVIINTNTHVGLENVVIDGKVDFAFVMDTTILLPSKREQLVYEPLFPYHSLLAVPPNHPIAQEAHGIFDWNKRPPFDLTRLKDEPFIRQVRSVRTSPLGENIFNAYGFNPIEKVILTDESLICQLVNAGVGFALLQEHHALARKSGVFFRLDREPVVANLCLIYRKGSYLSKPAKAFIDLVKHHAEIGTWQSPN